MHSTIQGISGYWRPISGVARLLEELGELSEHLESAKKGLYHPGLAEELADIWIISTCTANQFNIKLGDSKAIDFGGAFTGNNFHNLVSHAGRIARIVNYYDGPKNPRNFDSWPTLGPTIAALHSALYRIANEFDVALEKVIDEKISAMISLEQRHPEKSFDPTTAESLVHFQFIRLTTACPYANEASLWGAPIWNSSCSISQNIDSLLPYLISFTKAAVHEHLDGFVIEVNDDLLTQDMKILARWFREFLKTLAEKDLKPNAFDDVNIMQRGWQFSFNRIRLFISVFSPLYRIDHPRYSSTKTFIILQPETSFDHHNIGSRFLESNKIKKQVRQRFAQLGKSYLDDVIDARIEASIYLPPRWEGDTSVNWWREEAE